MKKLLLAFLLPTVVAFGQYNGNEYSTKIKIADSLYKAKDYLNSAYKFSQAFTSNHGKGMSIHRYNAACSWALAKKSDSAFFQLNKIATTMNYRSYDHISKDTDLISLHDDKRWNPLLTIIKQNKEKAEAKLNKPLVAQLDSIYNEDQKYRQQLYDIEKKFGAGTIQMREHWKIINKKDSINLIKVKSILDTHGWLGTDIVGGKGNSTLFLVIQHSDQATQEKYLPMMREAVKRGNASGDDLALLEDRIAIGQGKKQIYGSQIGRDVVTQQYYVLPLEDPDNVDKRRLAVGLQPLSEYVSYWQIKWDVEQYKKDLPELLKK